MIEALGNLENEKLKTRKKSKSHHVQISLKNI